MSCKVGRKSKRNYNYDYFNKWSSNMAYLLGLLMADGAIIYNPKKMYVVTLDLQECDSYLVEFFRDEICPGTPVYYHTTYKSHEYRSCKFAATSKEIVESLIQHGIIARRTGKEIIPPNLPDQFAGDFLRGLFDGDGSITICDNYGPNGNHWGTRTNFAIACSNKEFLEQVKERLCFGYGTINKHKKNNCYYLNVTNKLHIQRLYEFMNTNGGMRLERKHEKLASIKPSRWHELNCV